MRSGTTQSGDKVQHGHSPQTIAPPVLVTGKSGQQGTNDCPPQGGRDGEALQPWRQVVSRGEPARRSRDDHCIEPEQQAAESGNDGALGQVSVELQGPSGKSDA